jgi:hypothetical protein
MVPFGFLVSGDGEVGGGEHGQDDRSVINSDRRMIVSGGVGWWV